MQPSSSLDQTRLFDAPLCSVHQVSLYEANRLVVAWNHKLGACNRPFRSDGFVLEVAGKPVAVAISASIVHGPAGGYETQECLELARLCACEPWANRVMLRLWREVCAPSWPLWQVKAAISYSHNALHSGDIYRFDGWKKFGDKCGTNGKGGNWGRRVQGYANTSLHGYKSGWVYEYAF